MTFRLAHALVALVLAASSEEYPESPTVNVVSKSVKPDSRPPQKSTAKSSRVLAALTGACLTAGCSGVRVLPDGTAACSAEAIAETRRLGVPIHSYFSVEILGLPGSVGEVALIKEGAIEVRVTGPVYAYVPDEIARSPLCTDHPPNWVVPPECKGETIVSDTALLYGEASLKGERVQIRLHQLRDGGMIGPFCGIVAQRRSLAMLGLEKNPPAALSMLGVKQLPPGVVAVWSDAEVFAIDNESQMPRL
jgi:hypothetical protein